MMWLYDIYYTLLFLALITGSLLFKRLIWSLKIFLFGIALSFVCEIIAYILVERANNNLLVYSIYRPIAFGIISYAFYYETSNKKIIYFIIIFLLLHLFNGFYIQPFGVVYDSNSMGLFMVFISIWSLYYLKRLLDFPEEEHLPNYALFWICCGILFYSSASLVYLFHNLLFRNNSYSLKLFFSYVRLIANCILYLSYIFSFLSKKVSINKNEIYN